MRGKTLSEKEEECKIKSDKKVERSDKKLKRRRKEETDKEGKKGKSEEIR